jgi:hypothetical protein
LAPKEEDKDLFDFSRVDQERIQEEEALRSETDSKITSDQLYLAREPKKPIEVSKKMVTSVPTSYPTPAYPSKRKEYFKKSGWFFISFSLAIPLLLVGGWVGFYKTLDKITSTENIPLPQTSDSEVLKAIEESKYRKAKPMEFAKIIIRTIPQPAHVYIDDQLVSPSTPTQVSKLKPNTPYRVRVTRTGYQDEEIFLNLQPNQEKVLDFRLKRSR